MVFSYLFYFLDEAINSFNSLNILNLNSTFFVLVLQKFFLITINSYKSKKKYSKQSILTVLPKKSALL